MKKDMFLSIILSNEGDMDVFAYPFASSQETVGIGEIFSDLRDISAERRA